MEIHTQSVCDDWKILSEAASQEQDPEKLIHLVDQLTTLLLRRETQAKLRRAAA
jgi:hypothetical protein